MRPLSRRSALLLGGLGLAGTVTGGTGIALTLASQRSVPTAGRTCNIRLFFRVRMAR